MKLIVRADDFGMTDGITWGILKGFRDGIVTCAGLMTNMDKSSEDAAEQIKINPQFCFGQDINLVCGKPITDPCLIPSLVDDYGYFKKSNYFRQMVKSGKEPLIYEDVIKEVRAQVNRYVELTGKLPDYINGHSFRSPNFSKALKEIADEYNIVNMDELRSNIHECFKEKWYSYPPTIDNQLNNDPEKYILDHFQELTTYSLSFFNCHPGFLDNKLLQYSSLNIARIRDLEMVTSSKIIKKLADNNIKLISIKEYLDLMKK